MRHTRGGKIIRVNTRRLVQVDENGRVSMKNCTTRLSHVEGALTTRIMQFNFLVPDRALAET